MRPVGLAVLLSPVAPPLLLGPACNLVGLSSCAADAASAAVLAYLVTLVLGMPAYDLLCLFRRDRLWHFALAGATIGALPALVLHVARGSPLLAVMTGHGGFFAADAGCGAASGAIFWVLARPDRWAATR